MEFSMEKCCWDLVLGPCFGDHAGAGLGAAGPRDTSSLSCAVVELPSVLHRTAMAVQGKHWDLIISPFFLYFGITEQFHQLCAGSKVHEKSKGCSTASEKGK